MFNSIPFNEIKLFFIHNYLLYIICIYICMYVCMYIDASVYENYTLPKLYIKMYYSIEAAVHQRIVRVRSVEKRR